MAILSNHLLSLKIFLISTGVLSMAVILKLSLPVITEFVVSELPLIWNFLISYLRPPYLYLVINFIIITIVASSKLHHKADESPEMGIPPVALKISADGQMDYAAVYEGVMSKPEVRSGFEYGYDTATVKVVEVVEPEVGYVDVGAVEVKEVVEPPGYGGDEDVRVSEVKKEVVNGSELNGGDEYVISRSSWNPPMRQDSLEFLVSNEKPPVSARFGHRKTVKASPEAGKTLRRVSKPKRQDTLESTWKTITEGRAMPLARHLKKSDTWESHANHPDQTAAPKMNKSETFNERNNNSSLSSSPGSGKLKKEPSLSQDELNRRVEAFINKFNEEMRLQRQASLNQYKEMISRGAH